MKPTFIVVSEFVPLELTEEVQDKVVKIIEREAQLH